MSAVINTNMASLVAQKNLSKTQDMMATSVERLSSGKRINRAKDDSAGLGISEKLQAQVNGVTASIRNSNDAISVVQTAEGAMNEVGDILQRMKELATQGNSGALSSDQRVSIQSEVNSLRSEIDNIASRTTFNGISLLSSTATLTFQTGNATSDITEVSLSSGQLSLLNMGASANSVGSDQTDFQTLTTDVDADITALATARGNLGTIQNRLGNVIGNLQAQSENLQASRGRIVDTDYAAETAKMTKTQIQQQAATAMLAQANQMPNIVLSLLK